MSIEENNGNYAELVREQNIAMSVLFLRLLRQHHPDREIKFTTPDLIESAAEPEPVAIPVKPECISLPAAVPAPINVRALNPIDTIARSACAHFNMTLAALLSDRRDRESVRARHIVMYVTKTLTTISLPSIGRRMGGRDHTTILHGVSKVKARLATDQALFDDVAAIQARAIAADPKLGALI